MGGAPLSERENDALEDRLRSEFRLLWPDEDDPPGAWLAGVMARVRATDPPPARAARLAASWLAAACAFLSLSAWAWVVILSAWGPDRWIGAVRDAAAVLEALVVLVQVGLPGLDDPVWVIGATASGLLAAWAFLRALGEPPGRRGMEGWSR